MRRRVVRGLQLGLTATVCMAIAATVSFRHARTVADRFIGPPAEQLQPFREALVPIGRHPITARWGWVFAYGDQHHDGVMVYVSPSGEIVGTNPLDLGERLRLQRSAEGRASRSGSGR